MSSMENRSAALWTRGMIAVLIAQFLSAMADNALLFGALALLKSEHYPNWAAPLLQEFFVAAFILLAPFAGPFADSVPKGRVMLISNGLKLAGVLGMWAGWNPFLAYGLVGVGAAAAVNLLIPRLPPAHSLSAFSLPSLVRDFATQYARSCAILTPRSR
jgi:MFS family permease